ncbi:MAG: nicotinate (nicotinamide) nucleotide adenylyltransferase [Nitrospirae bacterium]|jgi:nicotinate-nucleotide adenylyltransferase|nr:nicotinate (nicotinamide) nucleotide adenylyltransferase [Nitrospirota bacterium]
MKVGIFGGTFNPVHYGHLRAAEEVREYLGFKKIFFVPSKKPPLKSKDIADPEHRFEMVRLAVSDNSFFKLSDIEYKIPGKSYTVRTVNALKKENPDTEFSFILGTDAFLDIKNWWHSEELINLIDFVILLRPGFGISFLKNSPFLDTNLKKLKEFEKSSERHLEIKLKNGRRSIILKITPFQISSTEIRRHIRSGRSIKYLLPQYVQSYIIKNKLYR